MICASCCFIQLSRRSANTSSHMGEGLTSAETNRDDGRELGTDGEPEVTGSSR